MEFERSKRTKMHLDIAPLIDIVFLLLIFFMLTSNFINQPGIKITLPAAQSAEPQDTQHLIILITEDNRLFLNENEVDIKNLNDELKIKLSETAKKTVVIKADKKINLELAVKVMDISKSAGAENVVIGTDDKIKIKE